MANYNSTLTGTQIESALTAINGVASNANNGKILCVNNGVITAKSAIEIQGGTIDALNITQNGTYTHSALGGYSPITVSVPTTAIISNLTVTQNGSYNAPSGTDGYNPVVVNVTGGGGDPNKLKLYDMEEIIEIGSIAQSPNNSFKYFPPYTCRTDNRSTYTWSNGTLTIDGSNVITIYRDGYRNATTFFLKKIIGGFYNKLIMYAYVYNSSGSYRHCEVELRSGVSWDNYGRGISTLYKRYKFADIDSTAEAINAQTGITINATGNTTVPPQRIEMDISDVANDFYLAIWNCDVYVEIADMYFIRETLS